MSVKQFLALCRQSARKVLPGVPVWLGLPVTGKLEPDPEFKESSVKEWRGADTAQGDVEDERTSISWKYSLESRIYPTAALVPLLDLLNGISDSAALAAPNDEALQVIFQSASEMYGEGSALGDDALALAPHTGYAGATVSQTYLGGRVKDAEFSFKGGEAATMKMSIMGGPWIGNPEQAPVLVVDFSDLPKAFWSVPKLYLGDGASLTGAAPDYTDFGPGTMLQAKPDDLSIKCDTGLDDVMKMDGELGPSTTERKGQVKDSLDFTIDFADPAAGYSSYDAWKARFAGIQYLSAMVVVEGQQVIPGTTVKPMLAFYWPRVKLNIPNPDRKNDGTKTKVKITLESRVDPDVNVARYMKLILKG